MNKQNWKRKKPLLFLLIPIGIALLVWVVMLLWNAILPEVIGVNAITYWQALGIFVLSKILFGGFKRGGPRPGKFKRNFRNKLMNMSDEEKAAFKSEWKARCQSS
ncbi:hypothetical protein, partial [Lutimonas sp.]|uniref:hypothetical protein n=1 Tax=Lutimonas sp. TaxID=1872403 RepID=UPI003D9B12F1